MIIEIDDKATVIIDELGKGERVVIPRAPNQTDGDLPSIAETIYGRKVTSDNKSDDDYMRGWSKGYDCAVRQMRDGFLNWDDIVGHEAN